jgi:tetratricopeptide (TPR) repeat protein
MTDTEALLQELRRIRWNLKGEARNAALEAHLERVEANGDQPLLNQTLTALVDCYEYSVDSSRLLVPFSRLLRNYDTAPEHFDAALLRSVYWQFKWVVYDLIDHPDIPLASIEDWMAQWRRRYSEAGHSLHPFHEAEHYLAVHLGDEDRAARATETLRATEPDGMSDCEACRGGYIGRIAFWQGDHEAALELWRPLFDGDLHCMHEPHKTLSLSPYAAAAVGRLDQARADHVRGYEMSRGKDDMTAYVACQMRFCAQTGNEPRALEILAANLPAFEAAVSPDARLDVLEAIQATCGALLRRGMHTTEVPGPGERTWTAAQLHAHADAERRAICERFDERNGNDAMSRRSLLRVQPEQQLPHVPLGLKTLALVEAPVAQPEPSPEVSLEAALEAARAATAGFTDDVELRWKTVDRLATASGAALDPADEADVLLSRIEPEDELEHSLVIAARAQELFTAAGLPGRALSNRAAALGWRMGGDAESVPGEAKSILDEAAALSGSEPAHTLRARALVHIALIHHSLSTGAEPEEAMLRDAAAIEAELSEHPHDRRLEQARVQLAMAFVPLATEPGPRLEAVRKAFSLATAGEFRFESFICATGYTSLLNQIGDLEGAMRAAETGLAYVGPDTPPFEIAVLHLNITECATNLENPGKAESHAVQAAHYYDRAGEHGCAAVARHLLGIALAAQDRKLESVVMFEAALEDLPQMPKEEHWRLVDVRARLAEVLQYTGEFQTSLKHAVEALRLIDNGLVHPDRTRFARTAHLAGELLERLDRYRDAAQSYRRSEQSWRELGALPVAANPGRAALWADVRHGKSPEAPAAMRALAEELRSDWADEQYSAEYRAECRLELVKTLMQHANLLAADEDRNDPDSLLDRRRLGEEALAILLDGDLDPSLGAQAVIQVLSCLQEAGEGPEAWDALAGKVIERLDPERDAPFRSMIEHRIAYMKNGPEDDEYDFEG